MVATREAKKEGPMVKVRDPRFTEVSKKAQYLGQSYPTKPEGKDIEPLYQYSFASLENSNVVAESKDSFFSKEKSVVQRSPLNLGVVSLEINLGEPFYNSFPVRINKNHKFTDLRLEVVKSMNKIRVPQGYDLHDFEFRYANEPVQLSTTIAQGLKVENLNRIDVVFNFTKTDIETNFSNELAETEDGLLTEEMIPRSSSGKFTMLPAIHHLCRMSVSQLQSLKGFTIISEHGEICFQDSLNVQFLDADRLVSMDHLSIEIIDKDLLADLYGFNKPIKFTIRNLPTNKPEYQMKTELMRRLQLISARLTNWDMGSRSVSFVVNSTNLY